eukprot:3598021-Pyramimonas_sp.AAC.2
MGVAAQANRNAMQRDVQIICGSPAIQCNAKFHASSEEGGWSERWGGGSAGTCMNDSRNEEGARKRRSNSRRSDGTSEKAPRTSHARHNMAPQLPKGALEGTEGGPIMPLDCPKNCLLYTSDAADDTPC